LLCSHDCDRLAPRDKQDARAAAHRRQRKLIDVYMHVFCLIGILDKRICQRASRSKLGAIGNTRLLNVIWSQDVKHCFAGSYKIVSNDPSMTAPPHCLCTHDYTRACVPQIA
jgi:hypothetical protein